MQATLYRAVDLAVAGDAVSRGVSDVRVGVLGPASLVLDASGGPRGRDQPVASGDLVTVTVAGVAARQR